MYSSAHFILDLCVRCIPSQINISLYKRKSTTPSLYSPPSILRPLRLPRRPPRIPLSEFPYPFPPCGSYCNYYINKTCSCKCLSFVSFRVQNLRYTQNRNCNLLSIEISRALYLHLIKQKNAPPYTGDGRNWWR